MKRFFLIPIVLFAVLVFRSSNPIQAAEIHAACVDGDVTKATGIIKADPSSVNATDTETRLTPLHFAAGHGHDDVVELLLGKGAEINAKAVNGATALFVAASQGHQETVTLLLKHGANVDACMDEDVTPLTAAALKGHKAVVEILLNKGATVDAKSKDNVTALYVAAGYGHKEIVALLLAKGAEVNAKDKEGITPLYIAAYNGHKDVVEFLLSKGADAKAKANNGLTPLEIAVERGHEDIATLLRQPLPTRHEPATEADSHLPKTSLQHYSYQHLSFDCPSSMKVPDKEKFDVEKVRDMLKPSGIEILMVLMSADMKKTIQLSRIKREVSFDSLYLEKKSLADEINTGGVNVMGEQYTKFLVEKTKVSGSVPALSEYGEKGNGEVAVAVEFLYEGYDYSFMFIYRDSNLLKSGAKEREEVVQSIRVTPKE